MGSDLQQDSSPRTDLEIPTDAMNETGYAFDRLRSRERLSYLERIEDPASITHLETIGVSRGWSCLEVGAGGGSLTRWLCDRVGSEGHVLATDIDIRWLLGLDFSNLDIVKHDITKESLDDNAFDFVHARNLLIHLPQRRNVFAKLVDAVRRGGWILVEESDFITNGVGVDVDRDSRNLYENTLRIVQEYLEEERGVHHRCGAFLYGWLQQHGFEELAGEGRANICHGGSKAAQYYKLTWEQLKEPVLARGLLRKQGYDEFLSLFDDPSFSWSGPLRVSVRGRRPLD